MSQISIFHEDNMRPYSSGNCIGRDEEMYNNIFLNRPLRYVPFDLEYETNIKPFLIKKMIEYWVKNINDTYLITHKQCLGIVTDYFLPLLSQCFTVEPTEFMDYAEIGLAWESVSETRKLVKRYGKEREGLAGWLSKNEYKFGSGTENIEGTLADLLDIEERSFFIDDEDSEEKEKREAFLRLLCFFTVADNKLEYKSYIPRSLYEIIKNFLSLAVQILAQGYSTEVPTDLCKNIKYCPPKNVNSEEEATKIEKMNGIRMSDDMPFLILNGFEFKTQKDQETLYNIASIEEKMLKQGICFQDCCFRCTENKFCDCFSHVFFQSCIFEKPFSIVMVLNDDLEFDNCTFNANLNLSRLQLDHSSMVWIHHCFFNKGTVCDLSEMHTSNSLGSTIKIEDSQFCGEINLLGTPENISVKMKNVAFMDKLITKDSKFGKHTQFINLLVPTTPNIQLDRSRKELYETLKASGLEDTAKELDILPQVKENSKKGKIDIDEYQVAYDSGQLNTEFAAYLLGRTPNYLAKKRVSDKKQITRDSLPFIGEGKNITYPVEVLLAFKAKDWNRLKELRQKYPIPKDSD